MNKLGIIIYNIKKNVLKYKIIFWWFFVEFDKFDNGGKVLVMRRDVVSF